MARVHGKDLTTLTLAGTSLLADTLDITLPISVEMHDTHTLGDSWKEATPGLKGGDEITHNMFYENTATTGTWEMVTDRIGSAAVSPLIASDGTRTVTLSVFVRSVSLPVSVGDMMKFTATYRMSGSASLT